VGASAGRRRPLLLFLCCAAVVLLLDQGTKLLAMSHLQPHRAVPLGSRWVLLNLTWNSASAFGLIAAPWLLVAASALVCVLVLVYVFSGGLSSTPGRAVPLALVAGGALGNLLDRVRFAAVVDFIDFRVWPVFNIADVAITVGVAVLLFQLVRRSETAEVG
jgi:signal peptidase II